MKNFCEFLRKCVMKIIDFKKITKWSYQHKCSRNHMKMQKSVLFVKRNFKTNM